MMMMHCKHGVKEAKSSRVRLCWHFASSSLLPIEGLSTSIIVAPTEQGSKVARQQQRTQPCQPHSGPKIDLIGLQN